MSTAIWGEQESQAGEDFPESLLKRLLHQMMTQFSATGACLALINENIGQMEIRLHVRLGSNSSAKASTRASGGTGSLGSGRSTGNLANDLSSLERLRHLTQPLAANELVSVSPEQCTIFPVGATYPTGQDLVGYVWRLNEPCIMSHEDYLTFFYPNHLDVFAQSDVTPTWYLAVPIAETTLDKEASGQQRQPHMLGVVILYQTASGGRFLQRQRFETLTFAERFALYLQNEQLNRRQQRISTYLEQLQAISAAFPSSVALSTLVENVHIFVARVVDVSSMLITFYDRDRKKIYDVFAIEHGKRIEGLTENPAIQELGERKQWQHIAREEKQVLLLEPATLEKEIDKDTYDELLTGVWGDQRKTRSFILLPMKMFNRVIGSICLTSMLPNAYRLEEIQVLETMTQIIAVSVENANLYARDRNSLSEARQSQEEAKRREALLAGMNSALQSISSVLNLGELLHKFVEAATRLVQVEIGIFLELTPDRETLIAQVIYSPPGAWATFTNVLPASVPQEGNFFHDLIKEVRIPFKGTILEQMLETGGFFYLDQATAEVLASQSGEGGALFLRETGIQRMLMVSVTYQTELVGILGVHTPGKKSKFDPAGTGMLLALCGQAAGAIRNAQFFEEIQEKNAELEHMNKLKDEFLVTASHELRTPLTAISGYAGMLKRQSSRINAQDILRFAGKIAGAAQQLTHLVESITDAAKIGVSYKKLGLQISPVNLYEAVRMAETFISVNIEQRIEYDVPEDLWVSGDPLRVRQVISNLLDNAAKYSQADSRIEVIAYETTLQKVKMSWESIGKLGESKDGADMKLVRVDVHDEGEGITPVDQKRIFEKFVRAPRSLTTPVRGTGLGLYICRSYVEAMGGKLWLQESVPGEGSVFSFYLPRVEALPQENQESIAHDIS